MGWIIKIHKKQRAEAIASNAVITVIRRLMHYCVMNRDADAVIAEGFRTAAAAEAYPMDGLHACLEIQQFESSVYSHQIALHSPLRKQ